MELLRGDRIPFKDMAEVLRFQSVVRLATRFVIRKRDELWSTVRRKYMPSVEFGNTGIVRDIIKEVL